jgi:hypothetical protein
MSFFLFFFGPLKIRKIKSFDRQKLSDLTHEQFCLFSNRCDLFKSKEEQKKHDSFFETFCFSGRQTVWNGGVEFDCCLSVPAAQVIKFNL